ncbi:hypothetical protein [Mangrovibacterium sp.]|uniref:hypothetical protein n=1 Tax=Mangrovibacterium sp. TaxID=1961364 RepID=UPI0035688CA9
MKTFTLFLLIIATALFTSCEGDQGPQGIPGEDGYDILGTTFEIEGTFSASNDYLLYYEFPSSFTVYDGDVVMIYILWEVTEGLDVWRALPQSVFFNEGVLHYNFDYTLGDLQIFIDGTIEPALLSSDYLQDQIFRIAVIPSELAQNKSVDISDYNSVMKAMKTSDTAIQKIQIDTTTGLN